MKRDVRPCLACGEPVPQTYHVRLCIVCRDVPEYYQWAARYSSACERAKNRNEPEPPVPPRPLRQRTFGDVGPGA